MSFLNTKGILVVVVFLQGSFFPIFFHYVTYSV
jgi:hypothetical protein